MAGIGPDAARMDGPGDVNPGLLLRDSSGGRFCLGKLPGSGIFPSDPGAGKRRNRRRFSLFFSRMADEGMFLAKFGSMMVNGVMCARTRRTPRQIVCFHRAERPNGWVKTLAVRSAWFF
jgi:hypothetical protein